MPAANPFSHIELSTDDVGQAKKFYTKLFKWKLTPMKGMPYTMISTGSKETGGGMQPKQMAAAPTAWMPYVTVKDVKATLSKASKLGAQVVVPYQPLPGNGAIAVFIDPRGAALGLWELEKKKKAKARMSR